MQGYVGGAVLQRFADTRAGRADHARIDAELAAILIVSPGRPNW
jgi:hypothetical protein